MLKRLWTALSILLCCALPAPAAELSVYAASSLSEALTEVTKRYEQQHPEDRVRLNFAGSQTLATQIEQGAPAELFISANHSVMSRLAESGLVTEVRALLGNRLVVASNPELQPPLETLTDLASSGLLLVIGNPQVPIGYYTRELFANLAASPAYGTELVSRIKRNIVSEEGRVKAIIAKLLLGEADIGIVYQTDLNNSRLRSLAIPETLNPLATYPLAKVKGGADKSARLYDFLASAEAAEIFRRYGFLNRGEL